jgi:hypothetical protein
LLAGRTERHLCCRSRATKIEQSIGVGFGGSSGSAVGAGVGDGVAVGDGRLGGVGVAETTLLPLNLDFEMFAIAAPETMKIIANSKGRIFLNI